MSSLRRIAFMEHEVRAVLAGRKTQVRRAVKPQPYSNEEFRFNFKTPLRCGLVATNCLDSLCPYGLPGDRLWVQERWRSSQKHIVAYHADGTCGAWLDDGDGGRQFLQHGRVIVNPADGGSYGAEKYGDKWHPSTSMPRWASRIALEITGVRVERLQDLDPRDALAEGLRELRPDQHKDWQPGDWLSSHGCWGNDDYDAFVASEEAAMLEGYRKLWEYINGPSSWTSNPWVWVVEFQRDHLLPSVLTERH